MLTFKAWTDHWVWIRDRSYRATTRIGRKTMNPTWQLVLVLNTNDEITLEFLWTISSLVLGAKLKLHSVHLRWHWTTLNIFQISALPTQYSIYLQNTFIMLHNTLDSNHLPFYLNTDLCMCTSALSFLGQPKWKWVPDTSNEEHEEDELGQTDHAQSVKVVMILSFFLYLMPQIS